MSVIVCVAEVLLDTVCSTQSVSCSAVSTPKFRVRYGLCHLFNAKWLSAKSAADIAERQLSILYQVMLF